MLQYFCSVSKVHIGKRTWWLPTFSSTTINPDLDDHEQLAGESTQYFLTLVIQLQWLVVLGRLVTHAEVTTLPKLMVE